MLKHLLRFIAILLSIACIQNSIANLLPSLKALQSEAKNLVSRAMQNGFESIDGYSLSDIATAVETPRLFYMERGKESTGTRESGYSLSYSVNGQTYSESKFDPKVIAQAKPEEQARIGLHELLIAAKYPDQNYTLTLGIWYASLATEKIPSFISKLLLQRSTRQVTPPLYADGGSGTGVGGGGDLEAVNIKILLLDQLNKLAAEGKTQHQRLDLTSLAQKTLDCDFEFYNGAYAVQPLIYTRTYMDRSKKSISVPMMDIPWGAIKIRRDWFEKASADGRMNLLMSSLVNLAETFPTACQADLPQAPWERIL